VGTDLCTVLGEHSTEDPHCCRENDTTRPVALPLQSAGLLLHTWWRRYPRVNEELYFITQTKLQTGQVQALCVSRGYVTLKWYPMFNNRWRTLGCSCDHPQVIHPCL